MTTTTNETVNKILALLEGMTYKEADAVLQTAANTLTQTAQELLLGTPVKFAKTFKNKETSYAHI